MPKSSLIFKHQNDVWQCKSSVLISFVVNKRNWLIPNSLYLLRKLCTQLHPYPLQPIVAFPPMGWDKCFGSSIIVSAKETMNAFPESLANTVPRCHCSWLQTQLTSHQSPNASYPFSLPQGKSIWLYPVTTDTRQVSHPTPSLDPPKAFDTRKTPQEKRYSKSEHIYLNFYTASLWTSLLKNSKKETSVNQIASWNKDNFQRATAR